MVRWFIEGDGCQGRAGEGGGGGGPRAAANPRGCGEDCPAASRAPLPVLRVKNRFAKPREEVPPSLPLHFRRPVVASSAKSLLAPFFRRSR